MQNLLSTTFFKWLHKILWIQIHFGSRCTVYEVDVQYGRLQKYIWIQMILFHQRHEWDLVTRYLFLPLGVTSERFFAKSCQEHELYKFRWTLVDTFNVCIDVHIFFTFAVELSNTGLGSQKILMGHRFYCNTIVREMFDWGSFTAMHTMSLLEN